jgi:hypothetical protein
LFGGGTDQRVDRMVEVAFQEQRLGARQADAGDRAELIVGVAHAKQLRHEVANVSAVCDAETLLDKCLEGRSLRVLGQGAAEAQRCTVCLAE